MLRLNRGEAYEPRIARFSLGGAAAISDDLTAVAFCRLGAIE
jgi:hypothetical protein